MILILYKKFFMKQNKSKIPSKKKYVEFLILFEYIYILFL